MVFFPYKAELELNKIPFLTVFICLLCIAVFALQANSNGKAQSGIQSFCEANYNHNFQIVLDSLLKESDYQGCYDLFNSLLEQNEHSKQQRIEELVQKSSKVSGFSKQDSKKYIQGVMRDKMISFNGLKLEDFTEELLYYPKSYNLKTMFTSSIAHADFAHLLGNLFIFYVFAATVELMLGFWRFVLLFCCLAIGTSLAYSASDLALNSGLPTLGLSGVVMGMIGLFVYLFPKIKIRCFFWFLFIFKTFGIPAWILALWFVGWDIYGLYFSPEFSNINFVSHLSGAFIGFIFGFLFLRKTKEQFLINDYY